MGTSWEVVVVEICSDKEEMMVVGTSWEVVEMSNGRCLQWILKAS